MPNTIRFNENYPDITHSEELYNRALGLMPPVTQTLAKGPTQWIKGVAPKYIKRGAGARSVVSHSTRGDHPGPSAGRVLRAFHRRGPGHSDRGQTLMEELDPRSSSGPGWERYGRVPAAAPPSGAAAPARNAGN